MVVVRTCTAACSMAQVGCFWLQARMSNRKGMHETPCGWCPASRLSGELVGRWSVGSSWHEPGAKAGRSHARRRSINGGRGRHHDQPLGSGRRGPASRFLSQASCCDATWTASSAAPSYFPSTWTLVGIDARGGTLVPNHAPQAGALATERERRFAIVDS